MCGLVGAVVGKDANNFATKDLNKVMSVLLYLDTYRGHHSTGVLAVTKEGDKYKGKYLKEPVPGNIFVDTGPFKKLANSFSSASVIMGHNRYATMGGLSKTAAHPHVTNNVVLAHNGTLTRFQDLAVQPGGLNDLDSARIAYEVEANGSNIDLFDKLHGAYALSWMDNRTSSFYIARNDERPLWYCVVEKQLLLYASNKWMLEAVQTICKLNMDINPAPVPKEKLWEFDLKDFKVEYETKDGKTYYSFDGLTELKFENAPAVVHHYPTTYNNNKAYNHSHTTHVPYSNHKHTDPQVVSEVERSNEVLKDTGYKVGQEIEVLIDYIHFGSKRKKTGGVGYGCTMSKPSTNVVFVDVSGNELSDDAYSYNAFIVGANKKVKKESDEVVIYAKIKELNKVVLTPKEYSNIYSGDESQTEEIRKLLGNEIVVEAGDDVVVPGPNGLALSETTYKDLIASGCSKCMVSLEKEDPGTLSWNYSNEPVCKVCHEAEKVLNFIGLEDDESNRVFLEAV